MRRLGTPSDGIWSRGLALALVLGSVACSEGEDEHPAAYEYQATPAAKVTEQDRCASPNSGCPCATPGEVLDCGKVVVTVGDYSSCYGGSRICTDEAVWSDCIADQQVAALIR